MRLLEALNASPFLQVAIQLPLILLYVAIACAVASAERHLAREPIRQSAISLLFMMANLASLPVTAFIINATAATYGRLNIGTVASGFWHEQPFWAVVLVALFVHDLAIYVIHRSLHWRLLWPVHAIHHSDTVVNAFTSYRVHILESVLVACSCLCLLTVFGFPVSALAVAYLIYGFYSIYVHMDLDIGHGRLRHVLASPRFHRWHHADVPEAVGKNFSSMFPFIDLALGTYAAPGDARVPMGARASAVPDRGFATLLGFPFVLWGRQARGLVGRGRRDIAYASDSTTP